MDYGTVDSVFSIIEYMRRIGKEAAMQVLQNPFCSDLSAYDKGTLEELYTTGRGQRILDAAFPK